jgi:hypothetical protein
MSTECCRGRYAFREMSARRPRSAIKAVGLRVKRECRSATLRNKCRTAKGK